MQENQEFETPQDALAHFGVKGMKWGQTKRENRIQRLERVAEGKGNIRDNVKVSLGEVSTSAVVRNGGVAGAAKVKANNLRAVDAAIKDGTATLGDRLSRAGGDKIINTGKQHAATRFTPEKDKIKIPKDVSPTTKKVMKDYNDMSDRDFFRKYAGTKKTYKKRVDKYGDPYRRRTGKND